MNKSSHLNMFECGGTNPAFSSTTEAVDRDLLTVKNDYDDESQVGFQNIYHDGSTVGNHLDSSLASTSTQHSSSFQQSSCTGTLNKFSTVSNESLSSQENELKCYLQSCVDADGTSAKKQRERNANFSAKECMVMVGIYQENREALDCRKQTPGAKHRKNEIYQKMAAQVNRISFSDHHVQTPRTSEQLRMKMRKLKHEAARWRQARIKGQHAWADSKFSVEPVILDALLNVMDSAREYGEEEGNTEFDTESFEHDDNPKQTVKNKAKQRENAGSFKIKKETTCVGDKKQNKKHPKHSETNNTKPGTSTSKKKKRGRSKRRNGGENFTEEEINIITDMWETHKDTLNCPHNDNDTNERKLLVYKEIVNKLHNQGAPESVTRTLDQVRKQMADMKTEGRLYAKMKQGQVAECDFSTEEEVLERVVNIIEPLGKRQTIDCPELGGEDVQESTLNQEQRKQPENADSDEDNSTHIDLDQKQDTKTETSNQNTAEHSISSSDSRGKAETRKSRPKRKIFSPAEINIIVSVWEAHRTLLNCSAYGTEVRQKKTMVLKKIIDQMHSLGHCGSSTRTLDQLRKKICDLKTEGRLYAKMKRGEVKVQRLNTDKDILERLVNIIEPFGTSDAELEDDDDMLASTWNQSEKTDWDDDNSTDLDQEHKTQAKRSNPNRTGHSTPSSNNGGQAENQKCRLRSKKFTTEELNIIVGVWEGHRQTMNCRVVNNETNKKKTMVMKKISNRLHRLGGSVKRSVAQIRKKLTHLKIEGRLYAKMKLGQVAPRHFPTDKAILERIANIIQHDQYAEPWSTSRTIPQVKKKMSDLKIETIKKQRRGEKSRGHLYSNRKGSDRVMRILGDGDDYYPVSGSATGSNAKEVEREYVSLMIQKHLQSLTDACRDLRKLGVETGSMVFDSNSVMWCGSQRLQRIASHPHFSRIITGDAAQQVEDDKADEWAVLNLPPLDSSINTPSCSTAPKDTHLPAGTQNPIHHADKIQDFSPISVESVYNEPHIWNPLPSGSSSHIVGQSAPVWREGFSDATQHFAYNLALNQNSVSRDGLHDSTQSYSHGVAQIMPVLREGFTETSQNLDHSIPFTLNYSRTKSLPDSAHPNLHNLGQDLNTFPAENQMSHHNIDSITSHSFTDSLLHGSSQLSKVKGQEPLTLTGRPELDALSALHGTFVACGGDTQGMRGEEKTRTQDTGSSLVKGNNTTTSTTPSNTTPTQLSSSPSFICDICQALFSHLTTFIQHRQRHDKEAETGNRFFTMEDLSVNDNDNENMSENDTDEYFSTNNNEGDVPVNDNSDGGSKSFDQTEELEKEDEMLPQNNCGENLSMNVGGVSSGMKEMEVKTEVLEEDPTLNRRIKEAFDMLDEGSAQKDDTTVYPNPNDHMTLVTDQHIPFVNRFGVLDSRPRRFACNICGKRFVVAKHCRQHIQCHTGEKPHKCDQCGKTFIQKNSLKLHVLTQHRKDHACDLCGRRFSSYYLLKDHQTTVHPVFKQKADIDQMDDVFKCQQCGKIFPTVHARKKHELTHLGLKPFECDLCPKTFTNKKNLTAHKERHKGIRKFQCEECGFKFTEKCNLLFHMRLHRGEVHFKCEFCGQGFVKSSALTVHRRNHTGERPFLCEICGEGFAEGGKLTLHRRKHTGEKAYRCEDCGERFFHRYQLTVHRRDHTGIHPFTCSVCGKYFQKKKHLTIHTRLHTGEKPFVCDICGDKFHRSDVLSIHKKKHNLNPNPTTSYPATSSSFYPWN